MINCWNDFQSILAPFWTPSCSHVGHLSRLKTAQKASKTPPKRSKITLKMSLIAQVGYIRLQTCPRAFQTDFLSTFGRFLVDFG